MLETASAPRPTALATRAIPLCEIRVLRTADELIDAFRLRYHVYSALGYIQRASRSKLEIDEYDTSSLPFGAFDLGTNTMIGTLRLVVPQPLPYFARLVRRVLGRAGDSELSRLVL